MRIWIRNQQVMSASQVLILASFEHLATHMFTGTLTGHMLIFGVSDEHLGTVNKVKHLWGKISQMLIW